MADVNELRGHFTQACEVLFRESSSSSERKQADRWISEFQKQKEAWAVADAILENHDVPLNLAFLAAKTFHTKLRFDFKEQVDSGSRVMLRERLLQHLARQFGRGDRRAVATQLCLAVATLLIQMEEWQNPIKDLASRFGALEESSLSLIELLQIIPEEHENSTLNISEQRRALLASEMYDCCTDVLAFLERCAAGNERNVDIQTKVLSCARAWIAIVEFPGQQFAQSALLKYIFSSIHEQGDLFDVAIRVLISVLHKYRLQGEPEHMAVMSTVVPQVFNMVPIFQNAMNQEDHDISEGIANLFTNMASAYMVILLGEEDMEQEKLLELVLLASSHPSFEVAQVSWDFWQRLLERFYLIKRPDLSEKRGNQIAPYIERLLPVLLKHLEIPNTHPNRMQVSTKYLEEEFYFNRRDISDLLLFISRFLQTQTVLTFIKAELEIAAGPFLGQHAKAEENQNHHHPHLPKVGTDIGEGRWERVEALLFAANAVADACTFTSSSSASNVAVDYFMAVILRLPNVALLLRETCTRIFGSYAKFLRFNPQKLDSVVNYILETLVLAPHIGPTVTSAMLRISSHCGKDLLFAGTRMFSLAQGEHEAVRMHERVDLIECLALLVASQPEDQASAIAAHVANPAGQTINKLSEALSSGANPTQVLALLPGGTEDLIFALRTIELLVQIGNDTGKMSAAAAAEYEAFGQGNSLERRVHPAMNVFFQLWPSLCIITRGFCSNIRVVERLATLFKVVIRNMETQFEQHIPQFLTLMVECFQQASCSPFMYAAGIAMEGFARKSNQLNREFTQIVEAFSSQVLRTVQSESDFGANPDIVEDYFIMMDRITRTIPEEIILAPFFPQVFRFASIGIIFDHPEANVALLLYLENIFIAGLDKPENKNIRPVVIHLYKQFGQDIVNKLVAGIGGASPRSRIDSDSDGSLGMTLYSIAKFLGHSNQTMFPEAVLIAAQGCPQVSPDLADWFVRELCRSFFELDSSYAFSETLHEFSYRARLRLRRAVTE